MSGADQKNRIGLPLALKPISFMIFFVALTFLLAGRLDYWPGWIFNGASILAILLTVLLLRDRNDLIGAGFSWRPRVPVAVMGLAAAAFILGQLIVLWAKVANRFFSSVVGIQADRGQTVCAEGPYRPVRHPGYLGGLLYTLATPPLLGSFWGLVPAVLTLAPVLWRTDLEDRTLRAELAGYEEYAQRVRFKLIPHVW